MGAGRRARFVVSVALLTIIGTRPEAIKMVPVLLALKRHTDFESRLCLTGQHAGLRSSVLSPFGIRPDIELDCRRTDDALTTLTSVLVQEIGAVIAEQGADRIVVQGDTQSAVAGAMAGYLHRVPVAHVEAGLRTGNLRAPWPEEGNRRAIGIFADLHFAPTRAAQDNLLREGIEPGRIHVTGNTAIDMVRLAERKLPPAGRRVGLAEAAGRFGARRVLVTCHRRENWGPVLEGLCGAVAELARGGGFHFDFVAHPNPDLRVRIDGLLGRASDVDIHDPLPYLEFLELADAADLLVSDSGGLQEEAAALGKRVLVIRAETERPEGVEAGNSEIVGTEPAAIVSAVRNAAELPPMSRSVDTPFGDGQAADRIVACLCEEHRL